MKKQGKGKRKKKKVFLFVVEGKTDELTLSVPAAHILNCIYGENNALAQFCRMRDTDRDGGDITAKFGIRPDNIEKMLNKLCFKPFLKESRLMKGDIYQIIHIVDMDGAYIPDENIVLNMEDSEKNTLYTDEYIYTRNIEHIRERNMHKSENMNHLRSLRTIKIDSKTVPYSVYYFSSNLDHFIHDNANLPASEKTSAASEFIAKHSENPEQFVDFFLNHPCVAGDCTYEESWDYICSDLHSLQRHTNLDLLFRKLYADAEEEKQNSDSE